MRKYLFSASVISSVATGIKLFRKSLGKIPNWKTALLWVNWFISLVLAVTTVRERSNRLDDAQ